MSQIPPDDNFSDDYHDGRYPQDLSSQQLSVKIQQVLWFILSIIEALIGLRFLLRLIAANPASGFARFIYGSTAPLMAPFFGLTAAPEVNGSVFEVFSLIAMLVYALLFFFLVRGVGLILERPR